MSLLRQEHHIPGSFFFQNNFDYDQLNRLKYIAEKLNGTGNDSFKQTYSYDRYGNRRINTNQNETFGGVNNLAFDVDTGTNRLYALGELATRQRRTGFMRWVNWRQDKEGVRPSILRFLWR